MFVTILRRVMVEDPGLPFPESVAAGEIHKAGQKGAEAALQLFRAMGVGAVVRFLDGFGIFRASNDFAVGIGTLKQSFVRLGPDRHRRQGADRRHHQLLGAGRHARVPRRRLHHRARAGRAELRRRPAGVGPVRAAARLLRRPDADRPVPRAEQRRRGGRLGGHRRPPLPLHRPADRGRRHAGGRVLHAVQDAEEPDPRRSSAASPT